MERKKSSPLPPSKEDLNNALSPNREALLEELEELLSIVPPQQLRKSIHQIFARYLQTVTNETDLDEFKLLAEDFYFLNSFLEKAEALEIY